VLLQQHAQLNLDSLDIFHRRRSHGQEYRRVSLAGFVSPLAAADVWPTTLHRTWFTHLF
jgi:hypothetical protein